MDDKKQKETKQNEIVKQKARIFDLLSQQEAFRAKFTELEQIKNQEIRKLQELQK